MQLTRKFTSNQIFSKTQEHGLYLPDTDLIFRFLENKILIHHHHFEIDFSQKMQKFLALQDRLKKQIILRYLVGKEIYQFIFFQKDSRIWIKMDRSPKLFFNILLDGLKKTLKKKEAMSLPISFRFFINQSNEEIFLGSFKKQELGSLIKRKDPKEIFPIWFSLGKNINLHRESITPFFSYSLDQLMGIFLKGLRQPSKELLAILQVGYQKIREHLFLQKGKILQIFPFSFPISSGKVKNFKVKNLGLLDFEWKKEKVFCFTFHVQKSGKFILQSQYLKCRVHDSKQKNAYNHHFSDFFFFEKGKTYFFDRFI